MTEEQWRVDTRPRSWRPVLRGTVTEPHRRLKNAAGKETTLNQLWVEQQIGSYRGYSGSPVIAQSAGRVLGVLVEQAFWRVVAQLGAERRVANVLYAAPIEDVLAEFDLAGCRSHGRSGDISAGFVRGASPRSAEPGDGCADRGVTGRAAGGAGRHARQRQLRAGRSRSPGKGVKKAFKHGRFWLELGPDPPLQLQASLAAVLGDSRPIADVPQ